MKHAYFSAVCKTDDASSKFITVYSQTYETRYMQVLLWMTQVFRLAIFWR